MIETFRSDQIEAAKEHYDEIGHVCIEDVYSSEDAAATAFLAHRQQLRPSCALGEQRSTTEVDMKPSSTGRGQGLIYQIGLVAAQLGYPGWPDADGRRTCQYITMNPHTLGIRHYDKGERGLVAITTVKGASFLEFEGSDPYVLTPGKVAFHNADLQLLHRGSTEDSERIGLAILTRG